jgi:thioredoxin 2
MSTTALTCASCHTTNRVPTERLGDKPKCGKCKQQVLQGHPIELDSANVAAVLNNNSVPVLVDCWASWCGPCKAFAPVFELAAQQLEPRLRCGKLDTEAEPQLAQQWRIQSIPTLLLFRDGREVARMSGALPLGQLKQWLLQQGV